MLFRSDQLIEAVQQRPVLVVVTARPGVSLSWTDRPHVTVQPLSGRDAARKALEPPPEPAARLIYQRLTKDVEVSGTWPLAFETGTWEGHQGTPGGPVVIGGRYSAQWVKRAEGWLIRSEVFVALYCRSVGCDSTAVP